MSNVPSGSKSKASKNSTGSIDHYLHREISNIPNNNKHLNSALSPAEEEKSNKKANMITTDE